MKRLKLLIIGVLLATGTIGQDMSADTLPPAVIESAADKGDMPGKRIKPPKRLQTNFTIGTAFTTSSGYGSGLTSYISPSLSYRVSPRFTIRGGVTLSNTQLFDYQPWYMAESFQPYDANFTNALIWVEGTYMVTERLTISGAGFKEFTLTDNSPYYNPYSDNNPYGVYLNATYRINDKMFIQAGFGYTRNTNPYRGSPYMGMPGYFGAPFPGGALYPSPFNNDPFMQDPFYRNPYRP